METALETRVRRLEAANRRARLALGVLLLAAAGAVAAGGAEAKPDPVTKLLRVEALELVQGDGQVRGRLRVEDGEATLSLIGAEGRKAELTAGDTTGLALRNSDGKAQLIASLSDAAAIVLADPKGRAGSSWTFRNSDGTSLIGMRIPGEKPLRAVLSVMKDGRGYVKVSGPQGEMRIWGTPDLEFTPASGGPDEK
jgi:hypothetical protein